MDFDYLLSCIDCRFLIWVLGLCVAYTGTYVIFYAYLSPLSSIPGPWWAAVSDIYILVAAARLSKCHTIQALFKRYGPVVRLGPRRVVFCKWEAVKSVYCVHKLEKSNFYKTLLAYVEFGLYNC